MFRPGFPSFASAGVVRAPKRWLSWVALLTAFAGARWSFAQTAATAELDDERRAKAQEHFEKGLALARTGKNWDEALAEFLESRRVFATRSASRNAAIALRQLGRYAEALELYDSFLSEFADSMPVEQREAFRQERQALLDRVGELDLRVNESGVSVVVDGQERGKTPLAGPLRLDAGVHTLRLSKEGFETYEGQVSVAAGGRRPFEGRLKPEVGMGTLVVVEANGEQLDVVLDAAVVGRTPWQGSVSAGLHSVVLRGNRRGTAPRSIEVKLKRKATLTVQAMVLDAEALIEPVPADATVFVNGVFAGNGTWRGLLPSGRHRFEVVAPGHLPFRRDMQLGPNSQATVRARLEPNPTSALNGEPMPGQLYAEPAVGLLVARTLGGGADECACSERSRPLGWVAQARFGYSLLTKLALEISGGYWTISESMTRSVVATSETSSFVATDYRDSVALAGPFAAVSLSSRLLRRTPLTARLSAGVSSLTAETTNGGTFEGTFDGDPASGRLQISEPSQTFLAPFLGTELRFGYLVSRGFSVDVGIALTLILPSARLRADRKNVLDGFSTSTGLLYLADEVIAGPFLAASPSVAARWQF